MSLLLEREETLTTIPLVDTLIAQAKRAAKSKSEDDDLDEEETPKKGASKTDDEDDDADVADDWEKGADDDEWDPDFEEFDLPKSKVGGGKKATEEDDFKIEEDPEFKDLFAEGDGGFDDEDDDF